MKITEYIHALKIDFSIEMSNSLRLSRSTWAYLLEGEELTLIDTGVKGSWPVIRDYILSIGRTPAEVTTCILSHSHPDHMGGAVTLQKKTACRFMAHAASLPWIIDPQQQFSARPVPSFHNLVEGPVLVDELLEDGQVLVFPGCEPFRVLHTPGHEGGHLAFYFAHSGVLISVDALMPVGDMPTYDDFRKTVDSSHKLAGLPGVETLLSSFDGPTTGVAQIQALMQERIAWLYRIDAAVRAASILPAEQRTQATINQLGLPPACCNPVVQLAFSSH